MKLEALNIHTIFFTPQDLGNELNITFLFLGIQLEKLALRLLMADFQNTIF